QFLIEGHSDDRTCPGDSGAPLVATLGGEAVVVGALRENVLGLPGRGFTKTASCPMSTSAMPPPWKRTMLVSRVAARSTTAATAAYWVWGAQLVGFSQWQALGNDQSGTVQQR